MQEQENRAKDEVYPHQDNRDDAEKEKQPKTPLGTGLLLRDSFSILARHFVQVLLIGFVPSLLGVLVSGNIVGFEVAIGGEVSDLPGGDAVTSLVDLVVYSITTAFLVQLAYDAKSQRPVHVLAYIGPALRALVPITIMGIVVSLASGLATLAFIIPGLYVYAMFAVMEPATVIERAGFRGMARSAQLTREYRWAVLGAFILGFLCYAIPLFAGFFAAELAMAQSHLTLAIVLFTILSSIGTGFLSILTALIYARLREIKEGVGIDEIAAVFD